MSVAHVVITGASSGIGRALALNYASRGAAVHLTLLGRDGGRLADVAEKCRRAGAGADTAQIDVRDRKSMAAGLADMDRNRPIDLLVANAGISTGLRRGALVEDPDAVRAILDINVGGVLNTVEPLIEPMCTRGRGRIAITGSIAALRGLPYSPAYCATKAAVHLYAQSLRGTLRARGVGVTLIIPGFVHTPLNANLVSWKPFAMSDARAATIVSRALDRGKDVIAFPKVLYWATCASALLPGRVVDAILTRVPVDVPVTGERALR